MGCAELDENDYEGTMVKLCGPLCVFLLGACEKPPPPPGPPPQPPSSSPVSSPVSRDVLPDHLERPSALPAEKSMPAACRYDDAAIDKACNTVADCVEVQEISNPCGCASTLHFAFSAAGKHAYDKKQRPQAACAAPPPACVVHWEIAEDCSAGGTIELSCLHPASGGPGKCMTRVAQ